MIEPRSKQLYLNTNLLKKKNIEIFMIKHTFSTKMKTLLFMSATLFCDPRIKSILNYKFLSITNSISR